MSINACEVSGRLTKDARIVGTGETKAAKFFVAVNEWNRAKQEQRTSFVPVSFFHKDGNGTLGLLKKGAYVAVQGQLRSSSFEDKETGRRQFRLEVIARRIDVPKIKTIQASTEGQTETAPKGEKKRAGYEKKGRPGREELPF